LVIYVSPDIESLKRQTLFLKALRTAIDSQFLSRGASLIGDSRALIFFCLLAPARQLHSMIRPTFGFSAPCRCVTVRTDALATIGRRAGLTAVELYIESGCIHIQVIPCAN
jgi:hypothetical protein